MTLSLSIQHLPAPILEFGNFGEATDPKMGLLHHGPFSLRFGAAHKREVAYGLVGPQSMIDLASAWFARCTRPININHANAIMYPDFPGFSSAFRSELVTSPQWTAIVGEDLIQRNLALKPADRFNALLDLYGRNVERMANADVRPDVVICCLPKEVIDRCRTVLNPRLTTEQLKTVQKQLHDRQQGQLTMFEDEVSEETPEDLLFRDFRRALKARAMQYRMPIQIGTEKLFLDTETNQDPATRAWNMSVALFFKAGGIPWRLKTEGPETCFVGLSFHHLRTTMNHLVYSSLAQAFSSEGDGFALRGEARPWKGKEDRQVHLTVEQAEQFAYQVIEEYRERIGHEPTRIVLHKTTRYDANERHGFKEGWRNIPIVELVTLTQRPPFRLVQFGSYPPQRGTLVRVNDAATFIFTTGYIPEWETYPGPHIPVPTRLFADQQTDEVRLASEVLGLARMNWNTARDTSGVPITLRFARDVGSIMAELPGHVLPNPSYRFYM